MKLKRLFTAVLSTALALSLCAMPAMATEGATPPTKPATSTSTIDTKQTGSITIYKRAELDTHSTVAGTGEKVESSSGEKLPNAGFSVYTVLEAGELVKYYDGLSQETEITVDSCFDNDKPHTADNLKSAIKNKQKGTEQFTDASEGKVVFNSLPVGLYLVIETTSPAAVTQKVEPFLVSIPMTRIGADASETVNKNQESWLYDVTVYPKNSIAKGNVTLVKKGVTGANTNPESLEGVTFELYKKNDRNNDSTQLGYTKTETLSTGPNGTITFANLTKGSYYLKETGYTSGNDKGYILNTDGKFAFDVNAEGKVAESTDSELDGKVEDDSFVISKDKTAQVQLTVYNYRPDIEKTVTKRNNDKAHQADYGVGDAVPFTLTIDVPKNITSLRTFKVTDTTVASQLVQKENSVKVSGTGAIASTAYEVTVKEDANKNSVMTVAFKPGELAAVAGGKITITYTATVQSGAVVAGGGNVNTAKIVYSRKTNLTEETDNNPYEITDKGVVYTFDLNIHKTGKGGNENDKDLVGVTFDLYKKVEDYEKDEKGDVATTIRSVDYTNENLADAVKLGLTEVENEKWIKVATLQTKGDGKDSVKGLPSGTYKLVETKTVNGYNLLSKPVDAKLNLTYSEAWQTTTTYTDGNLTKSTITTPTYTRGDSEPVTPGEEIKIVNRKGFTLPVTGGFGTLLFSGIGVLLVLAGIGVLFSLKKKPNRA